MITLLILGSILVYLGIAVGIARTAFSAQRSERILQLSQKTTDKQVRVSPMREAELMQQYNAKMDQFYPSLLEWKTVPKYDDPVAWYDKHDRTIGARWSALLGITWGAWLAPWSVVRLGAIVVTGKPKKSAVEKDLEIKKQAEYISQLEKEVLTNV